ncbi:DUF982 domain-containing protein [Pseudaminobacter soli (ex Li et al. 2025)]|uniref:DUF982 domain-containing protein n=1 Tax=Pseudaminobacter soli (ex Li et al. 2025) TaxID=1295366 RepID=A0A2P7SK68_9HYPH|nr:DUF982 domain-containing protein [Mesorhizobium soli]PSJ62889.1 DUF982 domain-containing protein [Mesorhizobium soli]
MNAKRFTEPVAIFVGLGFPREIETVLDAYEVLNEWSGSRGPWHNMALTRCRAALIKDEDVEAARIAFVAFARARGILAADALTASVERAAREWLEN